MFRLMVRRGSRQTNGLFSTFVPNGQLICVPQKAKPTFGSCVRRRRLNTSIGSNPADAIYHQAMQTMEEVKEIQKNKEKERSARMYEAWAKAHEAEKSSKAQGVTVVKTLVNEVRKEKKQHDENSDKETLALGRAMELLEEAALEHDHPLALVQLGNMALEKAASRKLRSSLGERRAEVEKAMHLFQKAGMTGSRAGWFNLGHLYWTGYPIPDNSAEVHESLEEKIIKPDLHEAMDAFIRAIDLGDADAMYLVGVHRMTSGGRENIHSGLRLVERAAEDGHGGALYYLALLHLNGEPNIGLKPCSESDFVERLNAAVEAGNVDALFTRGHSYYHGTEGFPQNFQSALHDFIQAAAGGNADAAVSAGAMLHSGIGVPRDQERAFELYQTAGEMGSIEGWHNVVACYIAGEGVPKSLETAQYIADTMLKGKAKMPHDD